MGLDETSVTCDHPFVLLALSWCPTTSGGPRSPRSPRRYGDTWKFSLETDYLPSMDPLHGTLNIVTSPSSHTIGKR